MASQYESEKVVKIWEQKRLNGLQMVKFECPRHCKPSVSFSFEVGWIPFSHYWPSGVIRNGSPVWKWKICKNMEIKVAQWAANGPVWIPKALKTFCLKQFWGWKNSLFPLLALWGNKNWPPSMEVKNLKNYLKVRKMEKFEHFMDKRGFKECKWSSLNAQGTQTPLSHPFLELGEFPFFIISPLG